MPIRRRACVVGSLAAGNPQTRDGAGRLDTEQRRAVDRDLARLAFDALAFAREFVEPLSFMVDRREHRRHLRDPPDETPGAPTTSAAPSRAGPALLDASRRARPASSSSVPTRAYRRSSCADRRAAESDASLCRPRPAARPRLADRAFRDVRPLDAGRRRAAHRSGVHARRRAPNVGPADLKRLTKPITAEVPTATCHAGTLAAIATMHRASSSAAQPASERDDVDNGVARSRPA